MELLEFYCERCDGELLLIECKPEYNRYKCDSCGHIQIAEDPHYLPVLDRQNDTGEDEDDED